MKRFLVLSLIACLSISTITGCKKDDGATESASVVLENEMSENDTDSQEELVVKEINSECIVGATLWQVCKSREKIISMVVDNYNGIFDIGLYDFDGNLIAEKTIEEPSYNNIIVLKADDASFCYIKDSRTLMFYDWDLNEILTYDLGAEYSNDTVVRATDDLSIFRIYGQVNGESGYSEKFLNIETQEILEDYNYIDEDEELIYDSSVWSYYEKDKHSGYYFVSRADESEWGFLDSDGNELAMYKDVTNFSLEGYAFATNDGETYFIIDKDFNVIKENVAQGVSAYSDGEFFYVEGENGNYTLYSVE